MRCLLRTTCLVSLCTMGIALFAGDPMAPKQVTITKERGLWRVAAPTLEAFIDQNGCMPRLRLPAPGEWWVHVPNFLRKGVGLPKERGEGGTHGAFFIQDGEALKLMDVKKVDDKTIVAEGPKARIQYAFTNADQTWTLSNKTKAPMQFLLVLEGSVNAVRHEKQGYKATPVNEFWEDATFFQGKRRLQIAGLSRLWGPGEILGSDWRKGFFQIAEVTLPPEATKKLTLTHGVATKDEAAMVNEVASAIPARGTPPRLMVAPKPVVSGDITIFSPSDYQVFQRKSKLAGELFVAGHVCPKADKLQIRISGQSLKGKLEDKWQDIPMEKVRQTYAARVPCIPGGWYKVEVRAMLADKQVANAAVDHVGLGEVFVGCGQSNSTNCGDQRTKTETRMVSSFSGDNWQIADDPQPGTHDTSNRGSFWPAFGDEMYRRYKVPIGVAATGHGGAPVSNWQVGKHAFVWTMTRILQLGPNGFRALLWHQGESDARRATPEYYFNSLATTIKASHAVAKWDFPWFVANASYNNPKETSFPGVREGQQRLWKEGIALEGPDTDTLVGDNRAGIHFAPKGLKNHGKMWADKVGVYLDKVLGE